MNALPLCPNCGYDLALDAPILINNFSMNGPGFPLVYQGKPIRLTLHESNICWALLKASPMPLKTSTIAERIGSDEAAEPDNVIKVLVCRIRKRLRDLEIECPILTITGAHMYLWDPACVS